MPTNNWQKLCQVVVSGKQEGQDIKNVLHFGTDLTVSGDTFGTLMLTQLATAVRDAYTAAWLPGAPTIFFMLEVAAKQLYPTLTDAVVVPFAAPGTGALAGETLPNFNAQLIKITTGRGGRNGRGRIFLSAPPEARASGSYLTDLGLEAVDALADRLALDFIAPNNGNVNFNLGILNRRKNKAPVPIAPANFLDARALTAQRLIAVLGRRKVGRGS